MIGNESHAWATWREHRSAPAGTGRAEALRGHACTYLATRGQRDLAKLAEDARTFAELVERVRAERMKDDAKVLQDHHEAEALVCDLLEAGHLELGLQVTADWSLTFGNIHAEMVRRGAWEAGS